MNDHVVSIEQLHRVVTVLELKMKEGGRYAELTLEDIALLNEQCRALTISPMYVQCDEIDYLNSKDVHKHWSSDNRDYKFYKKMW